MELLGSETYWLFFVRWLHVLSAIMWVGLLFYFNFVQTPTVPKIPEDLRPAIPRFIMPEALFWFRWAALSTIIWGLLLAWMNGYLVDALAIGLTDGSGRSAAIGIGMWFGLIMAYNVWFIIWPKQQIALGLVEADASLKPAAGRTAMLFSRTNTMLSIPMLYAMVSAQNIYY